MNTDAFKACLLATDDELGKLRQRPTDGNSQSDPDACHLTTFLILDDTSHHVS
jgi:hypothetical protein